MADTEETPAPAETPQRALASKPKQGDVPKVRTKAFRAKLLSRLPKLAAAKWEASDTLNVYQDFQGVVDLDSDAFLRPLEPLAEDRHE
jgi:hypothetical protein